MKAVGLDPGVEGSAPGVSGTSSHVGDFQVLLYEGDDDLGVDQPVDKEHVGEVWVAYSENTGAVSVELLGSLRRLDGWAANEDDALELFAEGLRPLFEREQALRSEAAPA